MGSNSFGGSLKLWHKFLILSLIAVVLAAIPTYLYLREAAKRLDAYVLEQEGMHVVVAGLKMIQLTQQHRGLAALVLGGVSASQDARAAKQREADEAYATVDALVKKIHDSGVDAAWGAARHDWETLRAGVVSKSITVPESYAAHTDLLPKLLIVNDLIGDFYGLSLDPDRDSYQLVQAMFYQLPQLTEELGKTRAKGAGMLASNEGTADDRLILSTIVAKVNDRLAQTLTAFNKAATSNPEIRAGLTPAMQEAAAASSKIAQLALEQVVKAQSYTFSAPEYVRLSTQAIDLQFALNAAASKLLDVMLVEKIEQFKTTRSMLMVAMLGLLAIAGWVARLISRSVTVPLEHAIEVAQDVASGRLINDFDVGSANEVGQLLRALKAMNDSLRKIVGEVSTSIGSIDAATRDIASGNADVSSRLESQASSLEETASSMEELTSTVRQNSENAQQANGLVASASGVAEKGSQVVSQVVQTMSEINESSRKIVDIIAVIDGIAFQTNILALNAAVEAARAGEQGRGFAVVASEVRTLAQRSAGAAKEIKALIGHSVEKVSIGNRLADDAGVAMGEILSSVKRITEIMSEIAVASRQQGAGIEQVNSAITQMDDMTQQNAALVEQTAAASATLHEQARALVKAIGVFKLDDDAPARAARQGRALAPARIVAALN